MASKLKIDKEQLLSLINVRKLVWEQYLKELASPPAHKEHRANYCGHIEELEAVRKMVECL